MGEWPPSIPKTHKDTQRHTDTHKQHTDTHRHTQAAHLLQEVVDSRLLRIVEEESAAQVLHVAVRSQLGDARGKHHVQKIDKQVGFAAHNAERVRTQVFELGPLSRRRRRRRRRRRYNSESKW